MTELTISCKIFNHNGWTKKVFYEKTKFIHYLFVHVALKNAIEEANHYQEIITKYQIKKKWEKLYCNNKVMRINKCCLLITLNIYNLKSSPTKSNRLTEDILKLDASFCCIQETYLTSSVAINPDKKIEKHISHKWL